MKKKLFFSALCFTLLLIMMLSTTLAWFTDTETNVNTMVAGRVSIEQTVVANDEAIIVPTVEIERTITVTNDGNLPCYARTLIAFEDKAVEGTGVIDEDTDEIVEGSEKTLLEYLKLNGLNVVIPGVTNQDAKIQYTVADGTVYTIGYYLHGELAVGVSYTCLNTITLDATAPSEWQLAAGEKYQMQVLSQAVQTAGFTAEGEENVAAKALNTAFGELTSENVATWFANVVTTNP